jgi:hypothetical protein
MKKTKIPDRERIEGQYSTYDGRRVYVANFVITREYGEKTKGEGLIWFMDNPKENEQPTPGKTFSLSTSAGYETFKITSGGSSSGTSMDFNCEKQ